MTGQNRNWVLPSLCHLILKPFCFKLMRFKKNYLIWLVWFLWKGKGNCLNWSISRIKAATILWNVCFMYFKIDIQVLWRHAWCCYFLVEKIQCYVAFPTCSLRSRFMHYVRVLFGDTEMGLVPIVSLQLHWQQLGTMWHLEWKCWFMPKPREQTLWLFSYYNDI